MLRPCFLVVDREQPGGISTRKLVIETAKFNVITAYSGAEAIESLRKFPAVDGVVVDPGISDMSCTELVRRLKAQQPKLRVIVVGNHPCEGADYNVQNFDPKQLLQLLQRLEPETTALIQRAEEAQQE